MKILRSLRSLQQSFFTRWKNWKRRRSVISTLKSGPQSEAESHVKDLLISGLESCPALKGWKVLSSEVTFRHGPADCAVSIALSPPAHIMEGFEPPDYTVTIQFDDPAGMVMRQLNLPFEEKSLYTLMQEATIHRTLEDRTKKKIHEVIIKRNDDENRDYVELEVGEKKVTLTVPLEDAITQETMAKIIMVD